MELTWTIFFGRPSPLYPVPDVWDLCMNKPSPACTRACLAERPFILRPRRHTADLLFFIEISKRRFFGTRVIESLLYNIHKFLEFNIPICSLAQKGFDSDHPRLHTRTLKHHQHLKPLISMTNSKRSWFSRTYHTQKYRTKGKKPRNTEDDVDHFL